MRQIRAVVVLASLLVAASASVAFAQPASSEGFELGYTDVGPVIGVGGIGDAGISFGGRFEKAFKEMPNWRNGILGFGVAIDYYHFDTDFPGFVGNWDFTYIPISATVNYHFRLDNRKLDPFVGAGLGYRRVTFDCDFNLCTDFANDGVYFVGHGGIRYFWRPKLALYADVSEGAAALNIGIMWKLSD